MLSKPQFGWTDITIGDWTAEYDYNGSVDSDHFNQCRKRLCYDVFNLLNILNNKNDVTEIVC